MSYNIPHYADIDSQTFADQTQRVHALADIADLSVQDRTRISENAAALITNIRNADDSWSDGSLSCGIWPLH